MTLTTSYPGVYLIEDSSPGFSIGVAATMVPLFLRTRQTGNHLPYDHIICLNSWGDFQSIEDINLDTDFMFYTAIKFWFMNGGGKCYLAGEDHLTEAVSTYDDITTVVGAGANDQNFNAFVAAIADGYQLFGLFDCKNEKIAAADSSDTIMQDFSATAYASVYYPWCQSDAVESDIPPSVVAAVAFAQTDRTRGVWKAPANVVINGITPKYPVSDDLQGRFNQGKALNMIRTFPNVGTVVWGARTLEDSDNWRYISVRRLFNMVERDIQRALNKLVFEPNSQPTWQKVKAAVDNYLYRLWQQGALAGNKEQDAWFVQIGKDITMTEDDINQGKLIVKIGLAAVRPAEFILLQFSQDIAQ